ncbi:AraC family transcriptional regulator [Paenibacillus wynnii]
MPPPEGLSRDIECLRIATHTGNKPLEVKVCPSGYPGIVFQYATDKTAAIESIAIRSGKTAAIPILFLHGQGSEPSIMRFRDIPYTTIQVVFKPHAWYSLFGWDTSEFKQGLLFPDQFGAVDLEKQLQSVNLMEEQLYIRDHISCISVRELVAAFHISERQFQKRFVRVVGMTPNLFIRVRRVNEALKLMHSGQYERLSDVAYALNYYDQSHFIREMKSFSWVSPKHIAMRVREFHSDLAGSSYL